MYLNAIKKLEDEIEKSKNNPYVQVVGSFLLGHLENKPEDAEKIMIVDKTITKSLDEMRKAAEKKKVGNCAIFTPAEGFTIVLKYFGIESAEVPTVNMQRPVVDQKPKSKVDFEVNLDDFL